MGNTDWSQLPAPWRTPEVQGLGRLPMTTLRRPPALVLDGTWDFQLLDSPDLEPAGTWTTTAVPGLWTVGGHTDRPHYTNIAMPHDELPPTVPEHNPTGHYRRSFDWVAEPRERAVLHVGAVEGVLLVAVNGVGVGVSKDSHLAAEFDVTAHLVTGSNEVLLKVVKWSDASYVEDQDQWWHGGISRSVHVYRTPATRLEDVRTTADFDPVSRTGSLRAVATVEGLDGDGWTVTVDPGVAGRPVLTAAVPFPVPMRPFPSVPDDRATRPEASLADGSQSLWSLQAVGAPIPPELVPLQKGRSEFPEQRGLVEVRSDSLDVSPWSAESPALYDVLVELRDPSGRLVDRAPVRVGYRRVEVTGGDLLINGERVLFQGVNRHDSDPRTGRVLTAETIRRELTTLKRFNVNAVRTSHYPNDPLLLDLCDEFGLYVIDEADIEAHAWYTRVCDDPRYLTAFVERVSRMVRRDHNHASVFLWSLGNESGYGANHDAAAGWVRSYDPTRPLHYEGAVSEDWFAGSRVTDVLCPMYPALEALQWYSASPRRDRPLILCEYAYSQGNSTGALGEYWDLFESLPGLQGGFIWEFKDHGLDPDGDGRIRHGADFGTEPNDGVVLLNGVADSCGVPRPALYEARGIFAPVRIVSTGDDATRGVIRVRNRRHFTGLDAFTLRLDVVGLAGDASFDVPTPVAPPGATVELALPPDAVRALASRSTAAVRLCVVVTDATAWCGAGAEIAVQPLALRTPEVEMGPALIVHGSADGDVVHEHLRSGPRLNLWRALTDNDDSGQMDRRFVRSGFFDLTLQDRTAHSAAGVTRTVERLVAAYGDVVEHTRTVERIGEADWRIHESVQLPPGADDLLRVGVVLELDGRYDHVEWFGLGPWENYPDRRRSAGSGRWCSSVDDLQTGYVRPQENGGRGGVHEVRLTDHERRSVLTRHQSPVQFSAAHHTVADLEATTHDWLLPRRDSTHLYLDARHRGIGTAFLGPDTPVRYRVPGGVHEWTWRLTMSV